MKVDYSRENLMAIHPSTLRAMIVERTHHTVEIQLYEALARGETLSLGRPPVGRGTPFGRGDNVREMLAIWTERGLPMDPKSPDWAWVYSVLDMADRLNKGEKVGLSPFAWQPFDEKKRAVATRLIRQRRSVRHWTDERVPDSLIDEMLQAGLWAPHGCNLCSLRFLVIREENGPGLFRGSDIPGGPVHIVACQDRRVYYAQPGYVQHPDLLERNRLLDCGAAMQNMVLMAHALGLGAVWLTFSPEMKERLQAHFRLDQEVQIVTYLDVGYPAQTPMPPGRRALDETVIARV
jgi:nitroreductase